MHITLQMVVPEGCLAKKRECFVVNLKLAGYGTVNVHDVRIPALKYLIIFISLGNIIPYIFKGYRVKNITNCIIFCCTILFMFRVFFYSHLPRHFHQLIQVAVFLLNFFNYLQMMHGMLHLLVYYYLYYFFWTFYFFYYFYCFCCFCCFCCFYFCLIFLYHC